MHVYRLLTIVMLLLNRKKASAAKLAKYFETSPRTVYRNIEAICQAGIPIVSFQWVKNLRFGENLFFSFLNMTYRCHIIPYTIKENNME